MTTQSDIGPDGISLKITSQDKFVLHHILAHEFVTGRMPTMKDLIFYTKLCRGTLCRHLGNLERAGELERFPRGTLPLRLPK